MKKIFLSLPMNGRSKTKVAIEVGKLVNYAKSLHPNEDIEFVCTYHQDPAPEGLINPRLHYLGNSIKRLAECDYIIFAKDYKTAKGCLVEEFIAKTYGIPYAFY